VQELSYNLQDQPVMQKDPFGNRTAYSYGLDLYDFLVTGDVLDKAVYDISGLANANHNMDKLYVAIEIAKHI
jgi:YD repeat-containing protein